jgi:hypothetical protein
MLILEPYNEILDTDKRYVMIKSGRDAGKSKFSAQIIVKDFFQYERNVLVCRSNYGDLQDSMFQEIIDVLEEEHLIQFTDQRTRPLKIINKLNKNIIYFKGVGGADLSRTKGFKTSKKLSLIMFDELQQLPDQSNLDQALATFRRHLDDDIGKVLMCFNPEPQNSHWCNEFYRINQENPQYLTLWTSYRDIAGILSDVDLEAIEIERILNPDNYRYLYLGETNGLFGGVYHTFDRDYHLLTPQEVDNMIERHGIFQLILGIDPATTRDSTAGVPVAILNNGQCVVLECFHHDPQKHGALDNSRLYPLLDRWIRDLETKYELRFKGTPIHLVIDSAGADLVQLLQYQMSQRYKVWSYSQKKVIQMAQVVQNAFSKNILYVKDTGGIYNYKTNRFETNYLPLVTALESVLWEDTPNPRGFDKTIPNDDSDALTYALSMYLINPYTINFPRRQGFYERERKKEVIA